MLCSNRAAALTRKIQRTVAWIRSGMELPVRGDGAVPWFFQDLTSCLFSLKENPKLNSMGGVLFFVWGLRLWLKPSKLQKKGTLPPTEIQLRTPISPVFGHLRKTHHQTKPNQPQLAWNRVEWRGRRRNLRSGWLWTCWWDVFNLDYEECLWMNFWKATMPRKHKRV